MKVIIGSKNPVKIQATEEVFNNLFQEEIIVKNVGVESQVSAQPFGNETSLGAINRAKNSKKLFPTADYFIGLEGGLLWLGEKLMLFTSCAIIGPNNKMGIGTSGMIELPKKVGMRMKEKEELEKIMDELLGTKNIGKKEGAVGFLTKNFVTRKDFCKQSLNLAMAKFNRPKFFE